jgi:hypothetical protein
LTERLHRLNFKHLFSTMLPRVDISSQLRPFRGSERFKEKKNPDTFFILIACEEKGFQSLPAISDKMKYRASAFITKKCKKSVHLSRLCRFCGRCRLFSFEYPL